MIATGPTRANTIRIDPVKGGFRLVAEVRLPRPRDEVFPFFADARNLDVLTPPWLHFEVTTGGEIRMEVGARIDYRLKLRGIPISWRSRISAWEPPDRFVDEQEKGPYRSWHHEHVFDEVAGLTVARDIVHYDVPGGRLIHALFVENDVRKIFAFRHRKMQELFADPSGPSR